MLRTGLGNYSPLTILLWCSGEHRPDRVDKAHRLVPSVCTAYGHVRATLDTHASAIWPPVILARVRLRSQPCRSANKTFVPLGSLAAPMRAFRLNPNMVGALPQRTKGFC